MGAFEVYADIGDGETPGLVHIFSKKKQGQWPHVSAVIQRINAAKEDWANETTPEGKQ